MAETHHFNADKLFSVKGFVCVITGGGTGIGLMAAQALSANGESLEIHIDELSLMQSQVPRSTLRREVRQHKL